MRGLQGRGRPVGWLLPRSPHVTPCMRKLGALRAAVKAPHELILGIDIPIALKTVEVSGRSWQIVVPDIDAVMELYIAAGQLDRDPYWCDVWPSAVLMAEQLLARPELVVGRRVCEIGCGLGLAGLAAAASGAQEVVLLDREPLALQCALLNAQLNGIPISFGSDGGDISAVQPAALHQLAQQLALREAESAAAAPTAAAAAAAAAAITAAAAAAGKSQQAALRPAGAVATLAASSSEQQQQQHGEGGGTELTPGNVRAEVFDWSKPVRRPLCDVAMACDVLYEAFSVDPVARVVPQLLLPGVEGRLLLADPPDRARHNRECFLDILCEENRQFVLEECDERRVRVWDEGKSDWRQHAVAFMVLRRTYGGDTVGVKAVRRA